ncbi:hypothetical protein TEA_009064 [Camellia sinensis var. sinensis]|uniref:CL1 n=1 Tax=Camellia sinensis var. sinensis TaxID=542762 RepID=A0A4S4DK34_CAMSN|nr:hypothetical protein TEA_009064 [Camellia sinensis var. sinensis]
MHPVVCPDDWPELVDRDCHGVDAVVMVSLGHSGGRPVEQFLCLLARDAVYADREVQALIQSSKVVLDGESLEASWFRFVPRPPSLYPKKRRRKELKLDGIATLPHGTGKAAKIAVFADGSAADEARAAGANVVGGVELVEEIKNGNVKAHFDICITTHQFVPRLQKLGNILKSRMPSTKAGTVTDDVAKAVREAKRLVKFNKKDKAAVVHVGIGKVSYSEEALRENIGAFVNALLAAKPAGLKKTGAYTPSMAAQLTSVTATLLGQNTKVNESSMHNQCMVATPCCRAKLTRSAITYLTTPWLNIAPRLVWMSLHWTMVFSYLIPIGCVEERLGASLDLEHVSTQSLLLGSNLAQPVACLSLPYALTPLVGITDYSLWQLTRWQLSLVEYDITCKLQCA